MPIKVIEGDEGGEPGAAAVIVQAVDHGAKVLNCGIGTYGDGSGPDDDYGFTGLRIERGGPERPDVGRYALITGISSCEIPHGAFFRIPVIRVRKGADIVVVR
jgi:hypothetical protein